MSVLKKFYKTMAIILSAIFILPSCSNNTSNDEIALETDDDFFVYDKIEYANCFDVDSDGIVYTVEAVYEYVETDTYTGNTIVGSEIAVYSLNGEIKERYGLDEYNPTTISYYNNKLYCTGGKNNLNNCIIFCLDLETKEITDLYETELSTYVGYPNNALFSDSKLYFSVAAPAGDKKCPYETQEFHYQGCDIYSFDPEAGELKKLNIDFPCAIASTYNGGICIYAVDAKGTYFTFGEDGEKIYGFGKPISAFTVINENNDCVFSVTHNHTLNLMPMGENDYAELMPDVSARNIKLVNGYTFYLNEWSTDNNNTFELCRIKNSAHIKGNKSIKAISPQFVYDEPFGCGYMMSLNRLEDEEFALTVLSQSADYDVCVLSSALTVSSGIRDKGTFYPLNEIEGIEEYLDRCFPYVKETAINDDGEIWMLPIEVDINVLIYNEALCREYGIEFSDDMTYEQLIENGRIAAKSRMRNFYSLQGYMLNTNALLQFMRSGGFDNEAFRSFADFSKEKANYCTSPYGELFVTGFATEYEPAQNQNDRYLFSSLQDKSAAQVMYKGNTALRACALPSLTEDKRSVAACIFISVNPNSDNLESVLEYITSLTEYLTDNNPNIIFSENKLGDTQYSRDLYGIYENASISFDIPYEICRYDYEDYLYGNITLDECIDEMSRKLDIYLNE